MVMMIVVIIIIIIIIIITIVIIEGVRHISSLGKNYPSSRASIPANVLGKQVHAWTGPQSCRSSRLPGSVDSRHMKMARLSVLRTGRLYLHFC
jgi:hypothetical protein